jgi:hypothetical protein
MRPKGVVIAVFYISPGLTSRSIFSQHGRQVAGEPVVLMWWAVRWRTSRWTPVGRMRFGNSESRLSFAETLMVTFTLGSSKLAAWARADNYLTPSSRRLFLQSAKRPQWDRKSAPMRG